MRRLFAITIGIAVSVALHNYLAQGWWTSLAVSTIVLVALHPVTWARMQAGDYAVLYVFSCAAAIAISLILHDQFRWTWWFSAATGIVVLLLLPFLIGIVLGIGDRRKINNIIRSKDRIEAVGLPTGFIDPPGRYSSASELLEFLRETEDQPLTPQLIEARRYVQKILDGDPSPYS